MHAYDNELPSRKFDNLNFVELNVVTKTAKESGISFAAALALDCLGEIPEAFAACTKLGMFKKVAVAARTSSSRGF